MLEKAMMQLGVLTLAMVAGSTNSSNSKVLYACITSDSAIAIVRASSQIRSLMNRADAPDSMIVVTARSHTGVEGTLVALSWPSPHAGVLALVRCDASLSPVNVGYVKRLESLPDDHGGVLVVVDRLSGEATGWVQESRSLFQAYGRTLKDLWSGTTFEGQYESGVGRTYEIQATIRITADSIVRTGFRYPITYAADMHRWVRDSVHATAINQRLRVPKH